MGVSAYEKFRKCVDKEKCGILSLEGWAFRGVFGVVFVVFWQIFGVFRLKFEKVGRCLVSDNGDE